ncbi:hypothetical protein [Flectobacillus sp. BAB-3569]|uniref:hypothetical protein n=1 Tax=Flectobacillus sp. BAB-3569 TaxID=1509483 RepID=UPI000BA3192E|nr:hypothetical protein [Flectobacillus sp. BAB-3569]PAC30440.1 hypothetical protein BWI92_13160 [Flectobacillus sp. BAB-3569]
MNCPNCNTPVSNYNLNIQTDIGKCDACQQVFKLSALFNRPPSQTTFSYELDLSQVPEDMTITKNVDGISLQIKNSIGYGLIASVLPISVFLFFYFFATEVIDLESIDAKILYIIWGFGAILGGFMIWLFLQSIFGELNINLTNRGGNIEKGIKIFGWHSTYSFDWKTVSGIEEEFTYYKSKDQMQPFYKIVIYANQRIEIGESLTDEKRYFVLKYLQYYLGKVKTTGRLQ